MYKYYNSVKFLEDLFNEFDGIFNQQTTRQTYLATKMKDTGDSYTVKAEVPGFETNEIALSVSGDYLQLDAKNADRIVTKSYLLPDQADRDSIGASLKNGILTIGVAKKKLAEKQSKKIDIIKIL
jgi:HSP20 family molecular chaperone IbpA